MGDVTFSSAVLRGADVTIKSDRLVPTFSGRSADWPDYVDSLVSHFQGRGLGSFFTLSVHDFMSVLTHDTAQDNALAYRLGDAGKRSLVRVYDVRAARATPGALPRLAAVATLRPGCDDAEQLVLAAAELTLRGVPIDPAVLVGGDDTKYAME